ncbi:MAG TPA: hypothetical protein PK156_13690 [Polyangium sp.]|nr:hypothetical protein [Polyangium sp.]
MGCAIAGGCVMVAGLFFGSCLFCTALVGGNSSSRQTTAQVRTQPEHAQDKRGQQPVSPAVTQVVTTAPVRTPPPVQQKAAFQPPPAPRPAIPDEPPTIATVVLWIAEIGGYTGKSSGGPPGSTTIARGLERLQLAAELLRIQRE